MTPAPLPRGSTLIETMIAMAVLMIGASGLAALHRQSSAVLGDSQRLSRATVIAQDLVAQIETWDFDDIRLKNGETANDDDLGDSAGNFMLDKPLFDADEARLAEGGGWNGLPTAFVQDAGMERYFNVAYVDDYNTNGVWDAVRVAVIVRWPQGGVWRRVVFPFVKANPADIR